MRASSSTTRTLSVRLVVEAMLSFPSPICNRADFDQLVGRNPCFPRGSDQLLQVLRRRATALTGVQSRCSAGVAGVRRRLLHTEEGMEGSMKNALKIIALGALLAGSTAAFPQNALIVPPQDVLQLSASGTVEVQQDLLVLTLATTR